MAFDSDSLAVQRWTLNSVSNLWSPVKLLGGDCSNALCQVLIGWDLNTLCVCVCGGGGGGGDSSLFCSFVMFFCLAYINLLLFICAPYIYQ